MYQISTPYQLHLPTPGGATRLVFGLPETNHSEADFVGYMTSASSHNVAVRNNSTERAQAHGTVQGAAWLGSQTWNIELVVIEQEVPERAAIFDRLGLLFYGLQDDMTLQWEDAGIAKQVTGVRLSQKPQIIHQDGPVKKVGIQLEAGHPFITSQDLDSFTVMGEGSVEVVNGGNAPSWPTFFLFGPFTSVIVSNQDSGEAFKLTETVVSGEWITVDCRRAVVLKNSIADAYGSLDYNTNRLFAVDALTTPRLAFDVEGVGAATKMRVDLRSTWW